MVLQRTASPIQNKLYLFVITFLVTGVLVYNLVNLQIVKGKQYLFESKNSSSIVNVVRANRGIIYDRNGKKLVENLTKYNLNILKKENTTEANFNKTIESLEKIFKEDIRKKFNEGYEKVKDNVNIPYVKVYSKLDYHPHVFQIEANIADFPALNLDKVVVRNYLYPELLSHIIGYTGEINAEDYKTGKYDFGDDVGKFGIEQGYDSILRGQNGKERMDYYSSENQNVKSVLQQRKNGEDIYLTIDLTYQQKLYELIKKALEREDLKEATSAAAILEDPKTGNILAMASYPTFNSNLFVNGIKEADYKAYLDDPGKPLTNKATQYSQSPGSTFKPLTDMVLLQEGIVDENTLVYTGGTWEYGGVTFEDFDRTNWGDVDVEQALCVSSNIYHMKGVLELDNKTGGKGAEKLKQVFTELDIDKPSKLNLGVEGQSYFPIPQDKEAQGEPWLPGYLLNASIGQGEVLLNPLQLVHMTSTIANKGEVKTQKIILDKNNPKSYESKKVNIDTRHFETINEGLKCAAERNKGIANYDMTKYPSISEKTGSAQTGQLKNGQEIIHAWQITYAPADDPELAMSVFIEDGKHGYSGGHISKEFYKYWYEEVKSK